MRPMNHGNVGENAFDKTPDENLWCGHIANTASEFADAAVAVYQNAKAWRSAQKTGTAMVNTGYEKKALGQKLAATIAEIQADLQVHRNRNFMGAMLRHHSMASTKYMSKWIAAKNRQA